MAVDYDKWVQTPGKNRALLVEANVYTGGSEITRYISTKSQKTFGYYDSIISKTPVMSRRLTQAFGGRIQPGAGFIELNVADGRHISWIYDKWAGREIKFFHGDEDWDRADFEQKFTGKITRLEVVSNSTYRLHFTDRHADLDVPIQESTFSTGDAAGKLLPLCYGNPQNITPTLIDSTAHKYKIHDGVVEDVCVQLYVNGAISGITVTKDNTNGEFTLASDPSGTVTVDAKGAKPVSTWLQKPGAIMRDIVSRIGSLADPADLDTASFTTYDTGAPNISIYINKRRNILQVLDDIIKGSRLGWFGFDRAGLFEVVRLSDPSSGTSILDLNAGALYGDIGIKIDKPPRWKTTLGYAKNWTVMKQTDESETARAGLEVEYQEVVYEDANKTTIQTEFLNASAPDMEKSLIDSESDALAEATARQGLFNIQRYWVYPDTYASGLLADIGNVGTITDDDVNLSNKKFLITELDDDMAAGKVKVGGWF